VKNVKVKELNEQKINELAESSEPVCITVDSAGIKKDMIYFIDNLFSEREDFKIDMSTEKTKSSNYISGIDIIPEIPNVKYIRIQATLKYPLEDLGVFSKIIDLREIDIYGNVAQGIILDPLKHFNNLESVKIENGLTLRQQTFLENIKSLRHIDVGNFNSLSFDKNKYIKTLKVNNKLIGISSLPRALPELENIYLNQCKCFDSLSYLKDISKLEKITLKNIESMDIFPDLSKLRALKELVLYDMPKLSDISSFALLDQLETLVIYNLEKIDPKDFEVLIYMSNLKNIGMHFKNVFKDKEAKTFIKSHKEWTQIKLS